MFVLSQLLSAITQPVFWLALWWATALVLLGRRRRGALAMLWTGLALLGALGLLALPNALLRPLENRYPVPSAEVIPRHVGVIVLGGALGHPVTYQAHRQVPLNGAAERMTVPAGWLHRYPQLQLVFTGGEGRLRTTGVSEAELARAFYAEQGIEPGRALFEDSSRNTRENARHVATLLGERCKEPWLLVTSAAHMPRSVPEFAAVGCRVTPYPVDFRTGESTRWTDYSLVLSLERWQLALHEWLGFAVYSATR